MVFKKEVMNQLEGRDTSDLEAAELEPIDMSMPVMKEIGAQWLVEMASYIRDNPQFIVNGFVRSGFTGAIDELHDCDDEADKCDEEPHNFESESESDYPYFTDTTEEELKISKQNAHYILHTLYNVMSKLIAIGIVHLIEFLIFII